MTGGRRTSEDSGVLGRLGTIRRFGSREDVHWGVTVVKWDRVSRGRVSRAGTVAPLGPKSLGVSRRSGCRRPGVRLQLGRDPETESWEGACGLVARPREPSSRWRGWTGPTATSVRAAGRPTEPRAGTGPSKGRACDRAPTRENLRGPLTLTSRSLLSTPGPNQSRDAAGQGGTFPRHAGPGSYHRRRVKVVGWVVFVRSTYVSISLHGAPGSVGSRTSGAGRERDCRP